ncbi:hypothetical protein DOM22_10070 [Bdellovibrio sp. ZAP7]|uniref:hypothetical protein n=1 Tax=Bdellovibrio sp. ZAP7 TaxID=2231053 RepID=UPI00115A2BCA|nr:hypothetical protein [Bdellovibrio sp. ZAP7]QDK45468.1 hypothetical protein DOM22_10070 [Bdellovibrio sp. ZAP7]
MNILLWVLQVLMALHTGLGAAWKFTKTAEETNPSLAMIPYGIWIALAIIELLCAIGLVVPGYLKRYTSLISISALIIVFEMLMFCTLSVFSGTVDYASIAYWLIVAAICGFIAFGRRNA